ncbi:Eaa1 [Klebsiella pneumoniae]|nr:DUF551 domain-containing protein [Klebsiella pneumoniae]SXN60195.1 Eaa1 [Klebsiella pneumoniae]HBR3175477.1 DUF551 domain-containing protein [Klebsiella pneumoniae]
MTSKFSIDNRELLQRISSGEAVVGINFGNLIVRELAAFRLAAMDSDPVEVKGIYELYDVIDDYENVVLSAVSYNEAQTESDGYSGENLYIVRHEAQPAQVVPDEKDKTVDADDHPLLWSFNEGWNACRAAMLAASPQSPGSEPATVPGKWIPVSEQMPEVGVKVLCFPVKDEPIHATFNGQLWLQDISWSGSDEPIDNVIPTSVTHWMPLPAAPQEVSDA